MADEYGPLRDARDDDGLLLGVVASARLAVPIGDRKVVRPRALGRLPVPLGALAVDLGRVVARVHEDHGRVDRVLLGEGLDVAPRLDAGKGQQATMPGLGPAAHDNPEVATLDVDAHRSEGDATLRCVLLLDDPALRRDHGLGVPSVTHLVIGRFRRADHLPTLLAPGHGQPLLFEDAPWLLVAVLVGRLLGLEHQHAQLAPAHRRERVPMQADVSGVRGRSRGDERAAGVGLQPCRVIVWEQRTTAGALVGRPDADLVQVPRTAGLRILGEPNLLPHPGLEMVALRTPHVPVTLVGRLVQLMKLLPGQTTLGHEDALAHPAEGRDARAQFCEVSVRRHPALVGDGVPKRQALKVRLVPDAAAVERHAVEVRGRRAVEVIGR